MSVAPDWADELAVTIIRDVLTVTVPRNGRPGEARELIADRLRLVRVQGERAGLAQAAEGLKRVFA